jgi:VWFA-related protein
MFPPTQNDLVNYGRVNMRTPCLYSLIAALCFTSFACLAATAAQQDESETIHVIARLVNVDVLVTDRRTGRRVDDLNEEDFEVLDSDRPVKITHFSRGNDRERPFAMVLFVEVNNSIHPILPNLERKLDRALRGLQPQDQVAVFVFDPYSFQMLQELTVDRGQVLKALDRAQKLQTQKNKTEKYKKFEALPNALLDGDRHVQDRQPGARTALVVIGTDFGVVSGKVIDEVTRHLLTSGATVGGLLKTDVQTTAAKLMVRAMTLSSGGSARADDTAYFSARTGGEVIKVHEEDYGDALERIIGNLAQRYSLGFVPDKMQIDGRLHKLTVRVKPLVQQKNRKMQIRGRQAYVAHP